MNRELQVGDQLGEYRLVREIGQGAFGLVFEAEHLHLGRHDAIKVLLNATPAEGQKLLAEARKIANWRHPHITQVLNFAEYQGTPYLVMQYAPNGTLKECYPLGQTFPIETILPHIQHIAEGIQYAHDRQTLHLDLKPANVLLDEGERALISDFGIAVNLQTNNTHETLAGYLGTPAYAAPEQLETHPGKASDQYALATMVYQWLAGRLPFTGDLIQIIAQKIGQHDMPPLGANVRLEVAAVMLRGLAKDPHARYPSVRAFAEALAEAAREPAVPPGTLLHSLTGHAGPVRAVA
jgi:serine/threonine protein kinase